MSDPITDQNFFFSYLDPKFSDNYDLLIDLFQISDVFGFRYGAP